MAGEIGAAETGGHHAAGTGGHDLAEAGGHGSDAGIVVVEADKGDTGEKQQDHHERNDIGSGTRKPSTPEAVPVTQPSTPQDSSESSSTLQSNDGKAVGICTASRTEPSFCDECCKPGIWVSEEQLGWYHPGWWTSSVGYYPCQEYTIPPAKCSVCQQEDGADHKSRWDCACCGTGGQGKYLGQPCGCNYFGSGITSCNYGAYSGVNFESNKLKGWNESGYRYYRFVGESCAR